MVKKSPGYGPERISLLFRAGRRVGWVFEDPRRTYRPYPHPEPDPDLRKRRQLEREAESAENDAGGLGCGLAVVGLVLACVIGFSVGSFWVAVLVFLGALGGAALLVQQGISHAKDAVLNFDQQHESDLAAWNSDKEQHEARERHRIEGCAQWRAQELPTIRRLDVFGGTPQGWEGLITVFGASVLGAGAPLTVLDLSRSSVTEALNRLARQHRHDTHPYHLPNHLPQLNPFAGMKADQVADILVDLINSVSDAKDASIHHRLLTEICIALGGRITINRILAAVRVAAGLRAGSPGPDTDRPAGDPGPLTLRERRHIAEEMFPDNYRQSVLVNLQRIESVLSPLERPSERYTRSLGLPYSGLLTIVTQPDLGDFRATLLSNLLVLWLTHKVHTGTHRPGSTLLIAGADNIAADRMERLANTCDQNGIHLVTLYAHLRRDPRQTIGSGTVAFMRLGDDTDAAAAAQFIGRDHRFVLTQLADGRSESISGSGTLFAYQEEIYARVAHLNWSSGRSTNRSYQRVYEYTVEPTTLQRIPKYALLLVTHEQPKAVVQAVHCNPRIVLLDKFLPRPQQVQAVPTRGDPALYARPAQRRQAAAQDPHRGARDQGHHPGRTDQPRPG